jgi:hypothetical protein
MNHSLIPYGDAQGRPCLQIPISSLDISDPRTLVRHLEAHWEPAIRHLQFTGEVPWGSRDLDRAISHVYADPRYELTEIWHCRPVESEEWSALSIGLCLDVSVFFRGDTLLADVRAQLRSLPPIPQPDELVILHPDIGSVSAPALDEVCLYLDPRLGGGTIYVPQGSDTERQAAREVRRTSTTWAVRHAG